VFVQLKELVLFMLIFVIVIIAYGVTSQALMYMYLQRDPYPLIIRDIFYYPYWSLAGELYLDEMQGQTTSVTPPGHEC